MLFFSFVFQSAWVVVIAGVDLNASLITSVFYILKTVVVKRGKIKIPSWGRKGLLFAGVLLVISMINPIFFSGIELPVMTNAGYNFNRIDYMQVSFSFSNITIGLSVLLYLTDAIMISNDDSVADWKEFEKVYSAIFIAVSVLGLLHVALTFFGLPYSALRMLIHNEYQVIGSTYFDLRYSGNFHRLMSTFYEPSCCGAYLATSLAFFWFSEIKKRKAYLILNLIDLFLCLSSTGFATIIGFALIVFLCFVSQNKLLFKKRKILLIFCAACIAILIVFSNKTLSQVLYDTTLGKVNSGSADLRSRQNHFSLEAFKKTYGLGTGGNTAESYSLIYSLLSQTGVIGFITYCAFIWSIFRQAYFSENGYSRWQLIALVACPLIAQMVAIQAFNFCTTWMGICGFALHFSLYKRAQARLEGKIG